MADIFNRRSMQIGNSFAADSAVINFSGGGLAPGAGSGLLVQNMGFQYQQPVTRIYELGTQLTYYIAGRPQGNGNIGRILGPGPVVLSFYTAYGDVCKAARNNINIWASALCNPSLGQSLGPTANALLGLVGLGGARIAPGIKWCLTGVVLNSVGMTIAAQDMIMNETLGFMFVALEVCQASQFALPWSAGACCPVSAPAATQAGAAPLPLLRTVSG